MGESATAFAPGRVNLIGEHTDYNQGLALPFAIAGGVTVSARRAAGRTIEATALDLNAHDRFALPAPPRVTGWRAYVRGAAAELERAGIAVPGARLEFTGTVPRGAGLSSSAALEVALCLALLALSDSPPLERIELAALCSRIENDWVGAQTGLLDQIASICGEAERALEIDFRSLEVRSVKLELDGYSLVTLDSGERHSIAQSGYNERRVECRRACEALGIESLREVTLEMTERLPEPLASRARHVVSENERVVQAASALERGDLPSSVGCSTPRMRACATTTPSRRRPWRTRCGGCVTPERSGRGSSAADSAATCWGYSRPGRQRPRERSRCAPAPARISCGRGFDRGGASTRAAPVKPPGSPGTARGTARVLLDRPRPTPERARRRPARARSPPTAAPSTGRTPALMPRAAPRRTPRPRRPPHALQRELSTESDDQKPARGSLRAPPPATRPILGAASGLSRASAPRRTCPRPRDQVERVAKTVGHALEHRADERRAIVAEAQPDGRATGVGVGVGCALASQVGRGRQGPSQPGAQSSAPAQQLGELLVRGDRVPPAI